MKESHTLGSFTVLLLTFFLEQLQSKNENSTVNEEPVGC